MFLISAKVESFKSINTPQTVSIDNEVTVLVGMNEAGKTVFLKALEKSNDALGLAEFDPVSDYPRKDLSKYQKPQHLSLLGDNIQTTFCTDTNDEHSKKTI